MIIPQKRQIVTYFSISYFYFEIVACACLDTRLSLRSSRQAHASKQKTFHKIKWANKKRRFTFALACERILPT